MFKQMGLALMVLALLPLAAQGGVMDRLNKAGDKIEKKLTPKEQAPAAAPSETAPASSAPESAPPQEAAQASQPAAASGGSASLRPPRKQHEQYAPGLSFSTVLNGVKLLPKNGQFRLHHIQGTFLPEGAEGWAVLSTAVGEDVYKIDFKTQTLKKPYSLLDFWKFTDLRTGENLGSAFADLSTPGDYVLDFYLPGEHFYTFPFSVVKLGGDDPFADTTFFFQEGDWADWGYLYYPEADPEQNLHWKMWLRHKSNQLSEDAKFFVEIFRDSDGSRVCTSRARTDSTRPEWIRLDYDMQFPEDANTSHGQYFKAKDLLAQDGGYTLTVKKNGEVMGTWKFAIEGGKPKAAGRTVRGVADALTFVEGGRDAFWYKKQ